MQSLNEKYRSGQSGFSLLTVFMVGLILTTFAVATSTLLTHQANQSKSLQKRSLRTLSYKYIKDSFDCCKALRVPFTEIDAFFDPSYSGSGNEVECYGNGPHSIMRWAQNEFFTYIPDGPGGSNDSTDSNYFDGHLADTMRDDAQGNPVKDSVIPYNMKGELISEVQSSTPSLLHRDQGYYFGKYNFSIHCEKTLTASSGVPAKFGLFVYIWQGVSGTEGLRDPASRKNLNIPTLQNEGEPLCEDYLTTGSSPFAACQYASGGTPTFTATFTPTATPTPP